MRVIRLSIFVMFLCVSTAFGQRDAPVYESYLPQVSIYHDTNQGGNAIAIDFLFKKNGGPVEHTEHQAYILVYLKKDEAEILKLAGDAELVNKQNEKQSKPFLDVLIARKLVVPLESQVAKINSADGRPPRFADVRGYPRRSGAETIAKYSFPFKFIFTCETLSQAIRRLGNFSSQNVEFYSKVRHFNDTFKFMVFIPVNDSAHATKVSPEIHKSFDFGYSMDMFTALLYFRPLPYELNLQTWEEKTLLVYIH